MRVIVILGWLCSFLVVQTATVDKCQLPPESDSAEYPRYPLTFKELREIVLGGGRTSRTYYEVYSLDPLELKEKYFLPILRKTAVRWNLVSETYPGTYTNDYTGWSPFRATTDPCEHGLVEFETIERRGNKMGFQFRSVYPSATTMIGTSFSSCPERYLINWYCPFNETDYGGKNEVLRCRSGVRMSIYSSTGPNNMPWHLIVEDLCRNHSPKMDDKRWTMTYDATLQCNVEDGGRKKRSADEIRHYM